MSDETEKEAVNEKFGLKDGETYATDEQNQWFRKLIKENQEELMPLLKKLESDLADTYLDFLKQACVLINMASFKSNYEFAGISIPGSMQWSEHVACTMFKDVIKEITKGVSEKWGDFQKEDPCVLDVSKIFH